MSTRVLVRFPDGRRELHVAWDTPQRGEHFPAPGWMVEQVGQFTGGTYEGEDYAYEVTVTLDEPPAR
jgi:hypothetical protein